MFFRPYLLDYSLYPLYVELPTNLGSIPTRCRSCSLGHTQARRKQIKSEGANFQFKSESTIFQNFKVKVKQNLQKKGGGGVMLMLSLFGTFITKEFRGLYT